MVIAVDGPSGVGKSTVARAVATALGAHYLDTGAAYRAATLATLRAGISVDDPEAVRDAVEKVTIEYTNGEVLLSGEPVSGLLRSRSVTAAVSRVAAIPELRKRIVELQRNWVEVRAGHAVVEGRDIGTVVFPEAPVKIYLTASPTVRARRRAADPEASGQNITELSGGLAERDHRDATRSVSPLQPAEDAVIIDTSNLTAAQVTAEVLRIAEQRLNSRSGDGSCLE